MTRTTEQLLHQYLAILRKRQELDDPEACELEAVAWKALQMVWAGEW
jgi:hypothetical protein